MNAAPYRKGTLELLPPRSRPVVEYFQRAPAPEGDTACHYCLETLSALEVKSLKRRTCPICRHSLLATLCGIPVHRLDRPQQWTLLANEMQYIWEWKFRLFRSYQEYFGQHLQVFRTTQYSDEKAEFECLNDTLSSCSSGGKIS